ncbi:MAG: hypothetical protein ABSH20_17125, partial [Tepidisphaeraceae bacterium]
WPAPAILRRWLRQPPFLRALNSLLETLRFQSDFQLATAAVNAGNGKRGNGKRARDQCSSYCTESLRITQKLP